MLIDVTLWHRLANLPLSLTMTTDLLLRSPRPLLFDIQGSRDRFFVTPETRELSDEGSREPRGPRDARGRSSTGKGRDRQRGWG